MGARARCTAEAGTTASCARAPRTSSCLGRNGSPRTQFEHRPGNDGSGFGVGALRPPVPGCSTTLGASATPKAHTCPGSHLSLLGSSRRVGGHRRRGGRGARGAESSERRGPRPPEGARPLPPAEAGTAASGDGERRGRGPPTGCGAALPGGGPALGGSVPQPPQANGGSSGAGCSAFARAPLSPGYESQLPTPTFSRSPRPLTGPFPAPTAQGSRERLGAPHRFRGSNPAHRRFPGRGGSLQPAPLPWVRPCTAAP